MISNHLLVDIFHGASREKKKKSGIRDAQLLTYTELLHTTRLRYAHIYRTGAFDLANRVNFFDLQFDMNSIISSNKCQLHQKPMVPY